MNSKSTKFPTEMELAAQNVAYYKRLLSAEPLKCEQCGEEYEFDDDEPFAYCKCGTTEWGNERPVSYYLSLIKNLQEEIKALKQS
jgi:predicted Zn-ribbon and HTH transcriptional regulator